MASNEEKAKADFDALPDMDAKAAFDALPDLGAPKPVLRDASDPKDKTSVWESIAAAAMEDYPAIGGFAGEINALGTAASNSLGRLQGAPWAENSSFLDKYRSERNAFDRGVKEVRDAHPVASTVAGLGTALAVPIPGLSKAKAGLSVGRMAALGAIEGLGRSDSDLTKGDVGGLAKDALLSGGVAGLLTKGLNSVGGKGAVRRWLAEKMEKAKADQLEASEKAVERARRSAVGSLGGETSGASHSTEKLSSERIKDFPDLAQKADALLSSDAQRAMDRKIFENLIESHPNRMSRIEGAEQKLAEANAVDPLELASDYLSQSTIKNDVVPRLKNYAIRVVPPAVGAGIGGYFDKESPVGAIAGTLAGGVAGAAMGNPGTAFNNLVKNPRFRLRAAEAADRILASPGELMQKVSKPGVVAEFSQSVPNTLNRGVESVLASIYGERQSFDEYLAGAEKQPADPKESSDFFLKKNR